MTYQVITNAHTKDVDNQSNLSWEIQRRTLYSL